MVINSTNNYINKVNDHLSPFLRKSLNKKKKKNMTYNVGNPGPGLGQAPTRGGIKPVN